MLVDEWGEIKKYLLACKQYGDDVDIFSDDLEYLDKMAKKMIEDNSAKPLFIVNTQDEIVRQYAVPFRKWKVGVHNKLSLDTQ